MIIKGVMMDTIEELEKQFISSMYVKTIDFVTEAIKNLTNIEGFDKNLTFALINLQLANEFSLKSAVVSKHGIRSILKNNIRHNLSDNDILEKYQENTLLLKEYNEIKNFVFSTNCMVELDGKYKKNMEDFQLYRNRIIHSIYNFKNKTAEEIKKESFTYFLTVINSIFLNINTHQSPSHLVELLNINRNLLSSDSIYLDCIKEYLGDDYFVCVLCDYPSVTEDFFCLLCFESFKDNDAFGFKDCIFCDTGDCVIYDNLNDSDLGFCMNCEEKIYFPKL